MRAYASFVRERDRTARPANAAFNGAVAAWASNASFPPRNVLRGSYPHTPWRGFCDPGDPRGLSEADVARPGCPSRPGSPSALQNSV